MKFVLAAALFAIFAMAPNAMAPIAMAPHAMAQGTSTGMAQANIQACHAPQGPDRVFYPVAMTRAAIDTKEDPVAVWSTDELSSFLTPSTTIWQGVLPACDGQVIVSQIINRQCSSATACPARIIFRDGKTDRILLDYKQVCTLHQSFELRGDIGELRACDEAVRLKTVRPD